VSSFDLLHTSHVGFRLFFDRFRRKTSEKCLQIFRKRWWFPKNARICHDDRTTYLPSLSCRKNPLRARDLLGKILLISSRSSWGVSRFFRSCSTVWNIVAKLSIVECGEKFNFSSLWFLEMIKARQNILFLCKYIKYCLSYDSLLLIQY